jgi:hypothetical protein
MGCRMGGNNSGRPTLESNLLPTQVASPNGPPAASSASRGPPSRLTICEKGVASYFKTSGSRLEGFYGLVSKNTAKRTAQIMPPAKPMPNSQRCHGRLSMISPCRTSRARKVFGFSCWSRFSIL